MNDDELSNFLQAVRSRRLMVGEPTHREDLYNYPHLTEQILQRMSRETIGYYFRDYAHLIAYLARSPEEHSAAESSQLHELEELARLPYNAHRRWPSLRPFQRAEVLREMSVRYGSHFTSEFQRYAESGCFIERLEIGTDRRVGIWGRPVTELGFEFAGHEGTLESWVHPSGMRALTNVPSRSSGEGLSTTREEESSCPREGEPFKDAMIAIWRRAWGAKHGEEEDRQPVWLTSQTGEEIEVTSVPSAYFINLSNGDRIGLRELRCNFTHVTFEDIGWTYSMDDIINYWAYQQQYSESHQGSLPP
jgi:hypothetical protein